MGGESDAAYWSAQLAAYNSASNADMCHGRDRRGEPMMESGGWRNRRTFLSDERKEKTRSGLKSALVAEGRLSGRGSPLGRVSGICVRSMASGVKLCCRCGVGETPDGCPELGLGTVLIRKATSPSGITDGRTVAKIREASTTFDGITQNSTSDRYFLFVSIGFYHVLNGAVSMLPLLVLHRGRYPGLRPPPSAPPPPLSTQPYPAPTSLP